MNNPLLAEQRRQAGGNVTIETRSAAAKASHATGASASGTPPTLQGVLVASSALVVAAANADPDATKAAAGVQAGGSGLDEGSGPGLVGGLDAPSEAGAGTLQGDSSSAGGGMPFGDFLGFTPQAGVPTASASAAQAAPAARAPMPAPVIQVAAQMARAVGTGVNEIRIALDPAELGHVEVRLSVDDQGRVQANVTAQHQSTLDLLKLDRQALQQALQNSGLKADGNSLNFSLQGDQRQAAGGFANTAQGFSRGRSGGGSGSGGRRRGLPPLAQATAAGTPARLNATTDALDIRV